MANAKGFSYKSLRSIIPDLLQEKIGFLRESSLKIGLCAFLPEVAQSTLSAELNEFTKYLENNLEETKVNRLKRKKKYFWQVFIPQMNIIPKKLRSYPTA